MNKVVRGMQFNKGFSLILRPLAGLLRTVTFADASFDRKKPEDSTVGVHHFVTNFQGGFDQSKYVATPGVPGKNQDEIWIDANLVASDSKRIKRWQYTMMDSETLSVVHGRDQLTHLNNMLLEIGLTKPSGNTNPIVLNDNNSLVSHIRSQKFHSNPRLHLIWDGLRTAYTSSKFLLLWVCGKTRNVADILTKPKSPLRELLHQYVMVGKIRIPKF
jgi:hypothetical protein